MRAGGQDGLPRCVWRGTPGWMCAEPSPVNEARKSGATPSLVFGYLRKPRLPPGGCEGKEVWGRGASHRRVRRRGNGRARGGKGDQEGEAGRFLNSSPPSGERRGERLPPTSDPTHRFLPKLRELTQDDRCEEKQLSPPGSRFCPHGDQNPTRHGCRSPGDRQSFPRNRSGTKLQQAG